MKSYKLPIEKQREIFLKLIVKNPVIKNVLDNGFVEGIKDWYLVSGCLNQTVWNYNTKRPIDENISDYDVIYYSKDLNPKEEDIIEKKFNEKYQHLGAKFDVVNQASIHNWIKENWNKTVPPFDSTEDTLSSMPATISNIGVRKDSTGFKIMAPFGLTDTLEMIIRPNKLTKYRQYDYEYKAEKWKKRWPALTVIPW